MRPNNQKEHPVPSVVQASPTSEKTTKAAIATIDLNEIMQQEHKRELQAHLAEIELQIQLNTTQIMNL